ncbi:MAG: putative surface protein responsible for cell interaction [Anaerocolumna sp.]|jgi:ribosomal protein L25 (general stress protein Ctc)|nr:putative surface protein responsible for cell interaction [Anaerocolumna sp.]
MKLLKKWSSIFVLVLTVTLVTPVSSHLGNIAITQAATVKISQKTLTLEVGKSKALKISGSNKKVVWASSKKSVAVVSSTGKVTAKKEGSTVITATVDKKKYTCKVTVKKAAVNPLVNKAPFKAQETTHGKLKFIIPTTWKQVVVAEESKAANLLFLPINADVNNGSSNITVTYSETGEDKIDYATIKPLLEESITAELITSQLAQSGMTATVEDFKVSDSDTKLGKAFKIEYTVDLGAVKFTQTIYEIYIDNYNFEISITDLGEGVSPDLNTVADYLMESLAISK